MKRRILVIDDDPAVLQVTAFALRDLFDVEVEVAATGREGVLKLREQRYDVVVTDLILSDTSGEVVVDMARKLHPGVPTVMITGVTEYVPRGEIWADFFVSKPFRLTALTNALDKALQQAEARCVDQRPAVPTAAVA